MKAEHLPKEWLENLNGSATYNPPTAGDYAQHILSRIIDQQPGNREKFNKFQKRAGKRNAHSDK